MLNNDVTNYILNNVIENLRNAKYVFAKSMPKIPHEYTTRAMWHNDEAFNLAVKFIQNNGVPEQFWRKIYIYLYLDGYKYWTMGNPVKETNVINRVKC